MSNPRTSSDRVVLLLLLAVFIFNSPFTTWWTRQSPPWFTVFVIWFLVIALVAWSQHHRLERKPPDDGVGDREPTGRER